MPRRYPPPRATTPSPLVSIVTPAFQRAGFLRHTMASVRRQTYRHIEHIVVDGGSTDGTLELLREAEGKYPMRWVSEPDDGMYSAINKGLRMARGEILAYLNSDDLYFPWTIQVVVDAFVRRPDAGFVYGDALRVDDEDGRIEIAWRPPFDLDYICRIGFLTQPAVFWRRSVFEAVGPFDERLDYVADCDYWMRAGKHHRFVRIDEFLAVERNHASTLRESVADRVWPELDEVRARYVLARGPQHERMMRRHRVYQRLYSRLYRTTLLLQSLTPRLIRRGAWSRMLASEHLGIQRWRLFVQLLPRIGLRFSGPDFVSPDRFWLEQGDAADDFDHA